GSDVVSGNATGINFRRANDQASIGPLQSIEMRIPIVQGDQRTYRSTDSGEPLCGWAVALVVNHGHHAATVRTGNGSLVGRSKIGVLDQVRTDGSLNVDGVLVIFVAF